ncbi:MAG TPA: phosphoribosylaminoimidazolesuccinocarboxamide synthase [Symbiobacteriaceae bacterium]|nr:phosphoribosylaminoimidazolesuccinocarboxamide synthase [Symbiobacteriaceae bacterium]
MLLECPELGIRRIHKGKVREMFELPDDRLLLVATDRLSAFDVVFPQGIPGKGRVLNQLSVLWFHATRRIVNNHLITTDVHDLGINPGAVPALEERSMVVRRTKRIDVECVVRGYLAGSGWKEYKESRSVCGIPLPEGLQLNSPLPEPIFTPALKNDVGHDENVSEDRVRAIYGDKVTDFLKNTSLELYKYAAAKAAEVGIILADTKFEFGMIGDEIILIDEIFTPDSSRYWPADRYVPGKPIDSLDKQPIRDYVEQIGWNKQPPAPSLPASLVEETTARYEDALSRLHSVLG